MISSSADVKDDFGRAFKLGALLNAAFIAVEIAFGLLSGSVALLADAGHNFSDVIALLLSWFAISLAARKPSYRYTYGLRRTTILAALANALLLFAAVGWIAAEAISRFKAPVKVPGATVIGVAAAGLAVNGITALLFFKGKSRDLNIKSAFVHFAADAAVSFGVVVAGIVISLTGWSWVDPAMSLIVAGAIIAGTFRLLIDSANLALDAVPRDVDINAIAGFLSGLGQVVSVHDLHVWALSTSETALTAHLIVSGRVAGDFLPRIHRELRDRFRIEHSTIQVEQADSEACESSCN